MASKSAVAESAEREPRHTESAVSQFVGFRLDNGHYALAITKIREIILMKPITRLPQVPDSIEGLINLRGAVIPIINLRRRFGLAPRPIDDETRTIVVTVNDKTIGCIVDEVTEVMRIAGDQIQPVPTSMAAVARRYIAGLAKLDDCLLIILDAEQLFGTEEAFDGSSLQLAGSPNPETSLESGG
jgi:purine-binding chemotaxis protein CheW